MKIDIRPGRTARWRLGALVGLLFLAGVSPAAAATYCAAPATGCGGGDFATLADALAAAHGTPSADDVQLGAADYAEGPLSYADFSGTNPVTIRGSGDLESQITPIAGGATLSLVNGNADDVTITGPGGGAGLHLTLGTLSNSVVQVGSGGRGVEGSGAAVRGSLISPAGAASGTTAVFADATDVTDTLMTTTDGVNVTNPPVAVRRATIVTQGYGLQSGWDGAEITDSQILLNDPTAVGVEGICDISIGTITIDAVNLTVSGASGGGTAFRSVGGQSCGGNVAVSSSLVFNVASTASCAAGIGTASVAFTYSDADLSAGEVPGCAAADGGNNFFLDPRLATLSTYQPVPRFDSPLIDAGDPAAPGPGQPTDRAGLPRAVHGRRDIGAFEYGRRAPLLTAVGDPPSVLVGAPVSFTATTSDLDLGDAVTVAWSFDDGGSAVGTAASHAFSSAGPHSATATATDSAGLTTSRVVDVAVAKPPDTKPPQTKITKHPKKRTTKRRAKFEFSSDEAGAGFECTLDKAPPTKCTSPFVKRVKAGRKPLAHRFSVRAIDRAGNRDGTPASYRWKVGKKHR